MREVSVEVEWSFWQRLKARLGNGAASPGRLAYHEEPIEDGKSGSPVKETTRGAVVRAHGRGRNTRYYGWTFRIMADTEPVASLPDGTEVLLRVEYDYHGWLLWGFVATRRVKGGRRRFWRSKRTADLFDEWHARLSAFDEAAWSTSDGWLAWRYPAQDVDLRKDDGWLDPAVIRSHGEGHVVETLADEIDKTLALLLDRHP